MGTPISVFPVDRSRRWIIAPGVASTRQIQVRNDSAEAAECRFKVEEPAAASISPATISLNPRQSRNVDVIFLAEWSPATDKRVVVSVRDAQGNLVVNFAQEVIAADSSDCSVVLTWKEPILLDGVLSGLKFYCTITSRSATPRTFEIDFTPHPALRFPERKKVTLEPGESTTFDVPIEWHRNVHDATGWNHPKVIEVTVPVTQGRRTAVVLWDSIELYFDKYLTDEDRAPLAMTPPEISSAPSFPGHAAEGGNEEDYQRLLSLKQLEQAVVGSAQLRFKPVPSELDRPASRRLSAATLATLVIGLIALVVAAIFFFRPQLPQPSVVYHLTPVPLGSLSAVPLAKKKTPIKPSPHASATPPTALGSVAAGATATVTTQNVATALPTAPRKPPAAQAPATRPPSAAQAAPAPALVAPANRDQVVVALADPDVSYTSDGRAVSVTWHVGAQARALVHVLNDKSVIIGQASVRGPRSHAIIRLPRGYNRAVSIEVIAIGYHGERVVQSAYLAPPGG